MGDYQPRDQAATIVGFESLRAARVLLGSVALWIVALSATLAAAGIFDLELVSEATADEPSGAMVSGLAASAIMSIGATPLSLIWLWYWRKERPKFDLDKHKLRRWAYLAGIIVGALSFLLFLLLLATDQSIGPPAAAIWGPTILAWLAMVRFTLQPKLNRDRSVEAEAPDRIYVGHAAERRPPPPSVVTLYVPDPPPPSGRMTTPPPPPVWSRIETRGEVRRWFKRKRVVIPAA